MLISLRMKCLADLDTKGEKAKTFFKYVEVFYEKACMVYEDKDKYKINVNVECANKVLNLITLTPK